LVLEEESDRVRVEVEIAAATASDLKEYTRWVELSSSLTTAEATSKTVDFALRKVFLRDSLWQEHRRGAHQERPAPTAPMAASTPASPPAAARSPALPLPSGPSVSGRSGA
jgi:hypothetical protein